MSEELKLLIKKRGVIKARQTLFKKYLEGLQGVLRGVELNNVEKEVIIELESRLEKYSGVLNDYDEVQGQIEVSVDESDEKKQQDDREEFENLYFKLNAQAKKIVSEYYVFFQTNNAQLSSSASGSHAGSQQRPQYNQGVQGVKLPPINLQKFSGDYKNWLEFRDLFDSIIHSNSSIPNIQKFHYLRASLEGGAAQVIRSIELCGDNYALAWETLCKRYENRCILVQNHVKELFKLPSLTNESSSNLRTMVDSVSKHITCLKGLNQPCESWDTLLIYILGGKLDKTTFREWEEKKAKTSDVLPTFTEFMDFLRARADFLENLELCKDKVEKMSVDRNYNHKRVFNAQNSPFSNNSCVLCAGGHVLPKCSSFLKLSKNERVDKVKLLHLCFNCLKTGHAYTDCTSSRCQKCKLKHHTLLHFDRKNNSEQNAQRSQEGSSGIIQRVPNIEGQNQTVNSLVNATINMSSEGCHDKKQVLLQTALVQVLDVNGVFQVCRVLLDSGSQSHFISNKCCDRLHLNKIELPSTVTGVGKTITQLKYRCMIQLQGLKTNFQTELSCLVIPILSDNYPSCSFNTGNWPIPNHINLADPGFNSPGDIDIIIGGGVYLDLLCIGQISLGEGLPTLQKTRLGWIIGGGCNKENLNKGVRPSSFSCHFSGNLFSIQDQLQRFWEVEEVQREGKLLSGEEQQCEDIFAKTTSRDKDGRFIVYIPLKVSPECLGESRDQAVTRFYSLENKLAKNPILSEKYISFMEEYKRLGHMVEVPPEDLDESPSFYFPHHCVTNDKSPTTKLRVVFDGSAVSDKGESLNSIQLVGPTLQDELFQIILRFRQHNVVICADIIKMYRQILIHPSQLNLQRIVWRSEPTHDLLTYKLQTVTYGTSSAPYLAVRCLKQLASESSNTYPEASKVIDQDFYMDDWISGSESVSGAINLCNDVSEVLRSGGFELQKWASNSKEVLDHLRDKYSLAPILVFGETEKTKTLGLYWSCNEDVLMFRIDTNNRDRVTKRTVLSDIAQIFDPLGLVAPCVIIAKVILQRLWLNKLSWDESLPSDLNTRWCNFKQQLPELNYLKIPRHVLCHNPVSIGIHGFSDASLEAYGACVYLRSVSESGPMQVRLLCSKSKVAPLKVLTIPRLELCAALLLANLVHKVKTSMKLKFDACLLWTDSSVCLSWIKTPPNLLQTFVGNRVCQIQSMSSPDQWNHISSQDNPADVLSRGINPRNLSSFDLWWKGPHWLSYPNHDWPKSKFNPPDVVPELKRQVMSFKIQEVNPFPVNQFSSLSKLQRVGAYCRRFIKNCQRKKSTEKCSNVSGASLSVSELQEALLVLIKISQQEGFHEEIIELSNNRSVSKCSKIKRLNPFLDNKGFLRVGGRLEQSNFDFEKKHPIVLDSKHYLTYLLFKHEHIRLGHAGPQLLLYSVRDKYWPVGGRTLARKIVYECVRCFRVKPREKNVIMGMLPADRVIPAPPFSSCGVDYAGPVLIKNKRGKGSIKIKGYIAVFVCFSTKAIHLELVTELTKEAFIATFRRFVARRGKPNKMFSDNGTNFVGANSELEALGKFLQESSDNLSELIANQGVEWHFIPAFSPHFGGLWEAGVKSCKVHLKRVLANAWLVYEDFSTVLCEIEAILNSRPLTPMSTDPSDYSALTPSHFLIGRPMMSLPDPDVQHIPENRLSLYQRIQQMQQHFWTRWAVEYVSELQVLQKWHNNQQSLEPGMLVVVKENNIPPLQWCMGRILRVHPGQDGVARVATIKTERGVIKRAFTKICVLPIDTSEEPSSSDIPNS